MGTLKTSKRASYSTFLDIINENEQIATEVIDQSTQSVPGITTYVGKIETEIYRADGIINGYLQKYYSIPTSFDTASWSSIPVAARGNTLNSTTAPRLGSVFINNSSTVDPRTAVWKITADSATTYSLFSYLEGSQGTGLVVSSDTTSTNGDVTILSAAWENTTSMADGDKFYFSVTDVDPLINSISIKLATATILSSVYNEQMPNDSDQAIRLWREGIALLNKMQRPFESNGLRVGAYSAQSVKSISVAYKISAFGTDESPYIETDINGEYDY